MAYLSQDLAAELKEAIRQSILETFRISLEATEIELTPPKTQEQGDISSPVCFRLSTKLGKPPKILAEGLMKALDEILAPAKSKHLHVSEPLNGFLNFRYTDLAYGQMLQEIPSKGSAFGMGLHGKGKLAIVDFSSPNIGKPMHIGHIRSTILGDSLSRILSASGYKVVSSNYLCESGLQTAKLLLALDMFKTKKIASEKDLLELYVSIHKEMELRPELEERARDLVLKMESGDPTILGQLSKVRALSTQPFRVNYSLLNIHFDEEVYDSDYVADGKKLVDEAIEKKAAFRDENGEVVADIEGKYGIPNLIILRSNGTTLYSTRDLGLAERQYSKYKFDLRIYVTASEQNLHFRQVFAILDALGRSYAHNLMHIGFGLISLEEGKLSTREGRVLLLEDVIRDSISLALAEVGKRQSYSDEAASEIARAVGIASLKYSILRISSEKDIRFSLREAVKFDGNTAAYLQYTAVRAMNIQRKAMEGINASGGNEWNPNHMGAIKNIAKSAIPQTAQDYSFNPDEKKLISLLSQYPQAISHASRNLAPYIVCEYLFKLALQFSSFYDSSPVLKAESLEARQMRLEIVSATRMVMQNGLGLLGIDVPERM
ncbi:MAG: arginine--tRNA ligase [Candidatus Micrarchaeota archaeon]